jgi:hypothetical protein
MKSKKINFQDYIGEYIVLTTNFAPMLKKLPDTLPGLKVICYKQKFVLAKALTVEDLSDEDFVDYLNKMWKTAEDLKRFIRLSRPTKN